MDTRSELVVILSCLDQMAAAADHRGDVDTAELLTALSVQTEHVIHSMDSVDVRSALREGRLAECEAAMDARDNRCGT